MSLRKQGLRLIGLVLCVLVSSVSFAQAQAVENDVFAVVKISNLQSFITSVSGLIDQFQPGMGGMVNSMMVGNMVFKNPEWTGMNQAGDYTVVVLNPATYPGAPYALIVPLSNKDEYVQALAKTLTAGTETDGVTTYTTPDQKSVFLAYSEGVGIFTENADVAKSVKALVDGKSALLSDAAVVKGQLTASLAMTKLMTAFAPMIDMYKQMLVQGMESSIQPPQQEGAAGEAEKPADPPQPSPEAMKNIVVAEMDVFLGLLQQVDKVQFGVNLEGNGIRLAKAVFPLADSAMAKFLAAQKPTASPLLGVVPQDGALVGSGALTLTPEFKAGYLALLKTMSSAGGTDEATVNKMLAWVGQAFDVMGSEFAFSGFSGSSKAMFAQVYETKDAAKAKELVAQYPELFDAMSGMYKDMGMEMKMQLADKSDVTGGELLNFNFGMNSAAIADPKSKEVFEALFGNEIALPVGVTEKYLVAGFGKDAPAQVTTIMGDLAAQKMGTVTTAPTAFGFPAENNLYLYLSVPKMIGWFAKVAPAEFPAALEIGETPGFGIAAQFVNARIEGEMFLPTAEIQAIMALSEQLKPAASATPADAEGTFEEDEEDDETADDASDDAAEDETATDEDAAEE